MRPRTFLPIATEFIRHNRRQNCFSGDVNSLPVRLRPNSRKPQLCLSRETTGLPCQITTSDQSFGPLLANSSLRWACPWPWQSLQTPLDSAAGSPENSEALDVLTNQHEFGRTERSCRTDGGSRIESSPDFYRGSPRARASSRNNSNSSHSAADNAWRCDSIAAVVR